VIGPLDLLFLPHPEEDPKGRRSQPHLPAEGSNPAPRKPLHPPEEPAFFRYFQGKPPAPGAQPRLQ
jgi:hypothetical protein